MEDPNSYDWLPPGWTVEERVRASGSKDKFYFPPSSELKFSSKVGVLRFLDKVQNNASSIQEISDNVVAEKSIVEGLPPGWKKKIKIVKKGYTTRRDTYYIDPESGYAFRTKKDVERYLQSREIRRNSLKPKGKHCSDLESKSDKFSSEDVTANPAISVSTSQSSDLNMIANDQWVTKSTSSGKHAPTLISEHTSSQGCIDEDAQEKQLQENSETKEGTENAQAQKRQHKGKRKKEINLPCRASKRLAGIKADPAPELTRRNQACQVAVKQSSEEETIINADKCKSDSPRKQSNAIEDGSEIKCKSDSVENLMNSPKLDHSMHFHGELTTPETLPEKTLETDISDKGKERFSYSPSENQDSMKQCVTFTGNEDKVDEKLGYTLDFPLGEMLSDPCIAFAIQTLTGETFETCNTSQNFSELKNSNHTETSAVAEEHDKKIKRSSNDTEGGNVKTDDKANENAEASSEKKPEMSWMDPSIGFTIKAIPKVFEDPNPKNCLQQQLSSLNIQHFGTYKPMFKQPFVDPTLQTTRNIGIGSGDSRGEDRRNAC